MASLGTVSSRGPPVPERRTSTPLLPRISMAVKTGSELPVASMIRSSGGSSAASSLRPISSVAGVARPGGLDDLGSQVRTWSPRHRARRPCPASAAAACPPTRSARRPSTMRRLRLPGGNALLDEHRLPQRLLHHRDRLQQHPDVRQRRRDRHDPARILHDRLGHEPVQPHDAALRVAQPLAHVGLPRRAGRAPVRAAHRGGDELPGRETGDSWSDGVDLAEHLVPDHQRRVAFRRGAERAVDELPVGAADADLADADAHLARSRAPGAESRSCAGCWPGRDGRRRRVALPWWSTSWAELLDSRRDVARQPRVRYPYALGRGRDAGDHTGLSLSCAARLGGIPFGPTELPEGR